MTSVTVKLLIKVENNTICAAKSGLTSYSSASVELFLDVGKALALEYDVNPD